MRSRLDRPSGLYANETTKPKRPMPLQLRLPLPSAFNTIMSIANNGKTANGNLKKLKATSDNSTYKQASYISINGIKYF